MAMKRRSFIASICFGFTAIVRGQQEGLDFEDVTRSVEQWMRENLDPSVLDALGKVDQVRVSSFFQELNRRLRAEDVYDLATLKETASAVLPLLRRYNETRPYGSWLQAHLDYLNVAEDFRIRNQPRPGTPLPPNPSPEQERTAWDKQLQKRPPPTRAEQYVPRLKPIFASQGTPGALVWLGEIESSFDPGARSPSGAVGMFQLMPATARSMGLSTSPADERLDADKNGRAAAKYLHYLNGRFRDWRLALAAYNAGETRVSSLLTRYNTRTYAAIARRLPAETQMYVPKFEATLYRREHLTLASLPHSG